MSQINRKSGTIGSVLRRLLAIRGTAALDIDDPRTTLQRREVILSKGFLLEVYREWYGLIAARIEHGEGAVLELGSGPGFLKEVLADARTSDVFWIPGVDLVCNAGALPVPDASLRSLVLVDVAHHIAAPREFLREAARALRSGGRIVMVEPWVTTWSRIVYTRLHHEPFRPDSEAWEFPSTGPLSGANGALPWMIFERDRATFEREFPSLRVTAMEPMMPFRYLLSGGVSMHSLAPGWTFPAFRLLERSLAPVMKKLAMFALIVVERRG